MNGAEQRMKLIGTDMPIKNQKAKKKKVRSLTLREKRLIKYLPQAKTISEAMRKAGYSESIINSGKARKEVLQKPTIIEVMEKQGITDERVMQVLDDGLKADKVISATIIAGNGEGMKDADSMSKDFIEVPDHPTRHKFFDSACKLKSLYPSEKVEVEHTGQVLVVHIPVKGEGW